MSPKRITQLRLLLSFVVLTACWSAVSARAQAADPVCLARLKTAVSDYQTSAAGAAKDGAAFRLRNLLTFDGNSQCIVAPILSDVGQGSALATIKSMFQQSGSSSGSGGSTNVVSKGTTANILAVATEYGAVTESTSGQTVTVQGTLAGIPTMLQRWNFMTLCTAAIKLAKCVAPTTYNRLTRISYSLGFNASQASPQVSGTPSSTSSSGSSSTSSQQVNFTANYKSLNSATAKWVILKGASATPLEVSKAIGALQNDNSLDPSKLFAPLSTLKTDFGTALQKWATAEFVNLSKARVTPADVEADWVNWSASLVTMLTTPQDKTATAGQLLAKLQKDAVAYGNAYAAYALQENNFFEGLRHTPVVSAEFDANLPVSQISNSTVRGIVDWPIRKSLVLNANAAGSWNNGMPSTTVPGARILRDYQFAGELAYTFGGTSGGGALGQSTASAAYYYQDQTSPSILNVTPGQPVSGITFTGLSSSASQVFAARGVINLVQMKFNYLPGKSNVNVPVSVTWSNRTDLVTQPIWRGQVGVSYDFDSLFGLGK